MTNINPNLPPRRPEPKNRNAYYIVGAIVVIVVIAIIFVVKRAPETATGTTMQPGTEAPATATPPAGGTATTP